VRAQHLAQLTKMQPKVFISRIRWLGSPYRHTILKCSMKLYLKVIGYSYYTCLPRTPRLLLELLGRWLLLVLLRRLDVYSRSSSMVHTYTHAQTKANYKKTVHQYNRTTHKTSLELFYALQRSRERENRLKRSEDAKSRAKTRSRGLSARKQKVLRGSAQKPGA
jgi:hypothetical protein